MELNFNDEEKNLIREVLKIMIFKHGETKLPDCWSLRPSEYAPKKLAYVEMSDLLHQKFNATHFELFWENPGKSFRAVLYSSEAFGAAPVDPSMQVGELSFSI